MTIHLPLPLSASARTSAETAAPIQRLRSYLHAHGDALLTCLGFVADGTGTVAGCLLIDEARRASAWSWDIDRRVARVRALLVLEHLDSDEDAMPASDLFDDIDGEAVHACCRHADILGDLQAEAAADARRQIALQPVLPRPAIRPSLPSRGVPALRPTNGAPVPASQVMAPTAGKHAV